jgi:hypothetical protein
VERAETGRRDIDRPVVVGLTGINAYAGTDPGNAVLTA